ncbi:MAG: asparagine synthetase B [Planctomycetota bacterium]
MCGILGAPAGEGGFAAALASLAWRGRDGEGAVELGGYRLGVQRLAITDPDAPQPVVLGEPGRRVAVVLNGNVAYPDRWRRRLRAAGHVPTTGNDAELVALAWRAFGDAAFDRLDGPFAVALVDEEQGELVLARDRFGEKPLFWTRRRGRAWPSFASTPRALALLEDDAPTVPPAALEHFLARGWLELRGVGLGQSGALRSLAPGHLCRFDARGRVVERELAPSPAQVAEGAAPPLETLLLRAVEGRLHGEPALLLSGGLDSSCLALFAARAGARPTCHAVDREGLPGEAARAEAVARRLGLPFRAWTVGPEVLDALPALTEAWGLPLGDPSTLVLHALCARARSAGARVVLSGEGGDELFHGYRRMRTGPWLDLARELLPVAVRGSLTRLSHRLSRRAWGPFLRFLGALDQDGAGYAALWTTVPPADLARLGGPRPWSSSEPGARGPDARGRTACASSSCGLPRWRPHAQARRRQPRRRRRGSRPVPRRAPRARRGPRGAARRVPRQARARAVLATVSPGLAARGACKRGTGVPSTAGCRAGRCRPRPRLRAAGAPARPRVAGRARRRPRSPPPRRCAYSPLCPRAASAHRGQWGSAREPHRRAQGAAGPGPAPTRRAGTPACARAPPAAARRARAARNGRVPGDEVERSPGLGAGPALDARAAELRGTAAEGDVLLHGLGPADGAGTALTAVTGLLRLIRSFAPQVVHTHGQGRRPGAVAAASPACRCCTRSTATSSRDHFGPAAGRLLRVVERGLAPLRGVPRRRRELRRRARRPGRRRPPALHGHPAAARPRAARRRAVPTSPRAARDRGR